MKSLRSSFFALVVSAPCLCADELSFAFPLVPITPTASARVPVPRFEPTTGRLDEVRIRLQIIGDAIVGLENLGPAFATSTITMHWSGRIEPIPGEASLTAEASVAGYGVWLDPFDGTIDYTGPSGEPAMSAAFSPSVSATYPAGLAAARFVRTSDSDPTVDLDVELDFNFTIEADGSLATATLETTIWYEFEVVYVYTPRINLSCPGDGTGAACPCDNEGWPGHGCTNSTGAAGGLLLGEGLPSVSADSLVLRASWLPNSASLLLQGTSSGASGVVFGDGLRCVGGTVLRLGNQPIVGGEAQFPAPGKPALSTAGLLPAAGGERIYQVWYRNSTPFCTAASFNITNALRVLWMP